MKITCVKGVWAGIVRYTIEGWLRGCLADGTAPCAEMKPAHRRCHSSALPERSARHVPNGVTAAIPVQGPPHQRPSNLPVCACSED